MVAKDGTVIWISRETKNRLLRLKSYQRETIGDVIKRLLDERERGIISDDKLRRKLEKEE